MKRLPILGVAVATLWSCLGSSEAAISSAIRVSEIEICWESSSNLIYQVQYRSDIGSNVWIDLGPPVTATGPRTCVADQADGPRRFYRVVGPDVVWIPPGTFVMGSPPTEPVRREDEGPQTTVTISRGFWMGKYEVTQAEYLEIMGVNPSFFRGGDSPVDNVSWFDAVAFCSALTAREQAVGRLPEGHVYRLPTEAEWEYACRAGTTTPFHYGRKMRSALANFAGRYGYPPCGGSDTPPCYGWCCYYPSGIFLGRTTAVGRYAPNAWGLYDMHGNVLEWCGDWDGAYSGGSATDPQGPGAGSYRVLRGGSWDSVGGGCRSAHRTRGDPGDRNFFLGFRVVLVVVP